MVLRTFLYGWLLIAGMVVYATALSVLRAGRTVVRGLGWPGSDESVSASGR